MKYIASLLFIGFLLVTFSSCKKGCTNSDALNYDSAAKQDDASCLFCDSAILGQTFDQEFLYDNNFSSPYYGDNVLNANMSFVLAEFSGNACRKLGMSSSCDPSSFFQNFGYVDVTFYNNIQDTIVLQCNVFANVSGTFVSGQKFINGLVIPPYSQVVLPKAIFFDCVQSSFPSASIDISGASFQYL